MKGRGRGEGEVGEEDIRKGKKRVGEKGMKRDVKIRGLSG